MALSTAPRPPLSLRELAERAHEEDRETLLAELGPLCLLGPAGPSSDHTAFRYATEHSARPDGSPSPLVSLLDSIVLPFVKRPGAAFPDVLIVGRASTSDLWIDDASVSKLHARITLSAGAPVLVDADSTNGTFFNRMRLRPSETVELLAGHMVRFGDRDFSVREPKGLLNRTEAFRALP